PKENEKAAGPNQKRKPADRSKDHRQARVAVRRSPAKHQVVQRRHRCRREAEPETIERQMVEPAAPWPSSFFVVDAANAADVKMFQSECIAEPGQHRRAEEHANVSRVASAFRRKGASPILHIHFTPKTREEN